MLSKIVVQVLALGILGLVATANAATPLTWSRSVDLAKQNNAELEAAEKTLAAATESARASESGYYPQISAELDYSRQSSRAAGIQTESTLYGADLSLSQNLFAGFADIGRVRQTRAAVESSRATLQIAKARVSYNLTGVFASLRFAQDSEKVTADIIHRREENMRLVELRYQSGNENKGSLLLSRAYLQQARYEKTQAHNLLDTSRAQLNQVLGFDQEQEFEIVDDRPLQIHEGTPDFKKLALETPDHRQAVASETSAEAALSVAKAGFLPSLSLTASLGKQGPQFFPENEHWSMGLGLTFPIFNGGRDFFTTRGATATWGAATANRLTTDRSLIAKLKQSYASYIESIEKLKVDEAFLEAAKLRAEVGRNKYNNGLLNFDQWDQIESDLIVRQKSALQSRRDRMLNEAAWEQAQGKGVVP